MIVGKDCGNGMCGWLGVRWRRWRGDVGRVIWDMLGERKGELGSKVVADGDAELG